MYERKLYKIKLEDEISIENARIMAVAAAGLQQLIKKVILFYLDLTLKFNCILLQPQISLSRMPVPLISMMARL